MGTLAIVAIAWAGVSVPASFVVGWFLRVLGRGEAEPAIESRPRPPLPPIGERVRVLAVDDDPGLRALLHATFDVADIELREAPDVLVAQWEIARFTPDVVILDVGLPGVDGVEFCAMLKGNAASRDIAVILLTGSDEVNVEDAIAAGADGFVRKPFSPLAILDSVRTLAGRSARSHELAFRNDAQPDDQLMLYARDLRTLLDVEHGQRILLQKAYADTALALARALESKDIGTGAHAQRVTKYALELAQAYEPDLLSDPGLEYGFLLHDIGKIGIPDTVLGKRGPLLPSERRLLETHTVLGAQMLGEVDLLQGESVGIVRHHHERWDGAGYPDRLARDRIPLGARVFAVADTLDAITSDRPYRRARRWDEAVDEIAAERGAQFDPDVVDAFRQCEPRLRRIHYELARERGIPRSS